MKDISQYKYLWEDEKDEWALGRIVDDDGQVEYVILHIPADSILTIEDDESYDLVVQKMLSAGIKIVH